MDDAILVDEWSIVPSGRAKNKPPCLPFPGRTSIEGFFKNHPDPSVPADEVRTGSPLATVVNGLFANAAGRRFQLGTMNRNYAAFLNAAGHPATAEEVMRLFELATQGAALVAPNSAGGTADTTTLAAPCKGGPGDTLPPLNPPAPMRDAKGLLVIGGKPAPPSAVPEDVVHGAPLTRPGVKPATVTQSGGWSLSKMFGGLFGQRGKSPKTKKPAKPTPPKKASAPVAAATPIQSTPARKEALEPGRMRIGRKNPPGTKS